MSKPQAPRLHRRARYEAWLWELLLGLVLGAWCFSSAFAAAPTLDHLFPIAVQFGTTNSISAIGKFDPWPPKVWVDTPGLLFKAETNSGRFRVEIATNAPVGPHLVRLFNEQGASTPRFLIVTKEPQDSEQEPNDDFTKPQAIERLPVSLNGRLQKAGDVDSFAVALEAGQTLIASLEAYVLGSPLDAVLRLVDARGVQMALNHDDGRTLDPFLAWTAKSAGTYVIQVFGFAYPANSDVKFTGGSVCVYRLHLSRGAYLHYSVPLGVQRGARTRLRLFVWNLGPDTAREFDFDGSGLLAAWQEAAVQVPGFDNTLFLPIGDGPELTEKEPNDSANELIHLGLPCAVSGRIDRPGDEDRFNFTARKAEKLVFEVQSASFGFPLDAWVRIEDGKGKVLAKSDDRANADPALEWTAAEDGIFVAAVGNVLHRGGDEFLYRLMVSPARPGLKAVVSADAFTVEPGKTNEVKLTVSRLHGFAHKLTVKAQGLPDDVKVEPVEVTEKGGEVLLKLVAASDTKPFSSPFQVVVTEVESRKEHRAIAKLTGSEVNNGVPGGFNKLVIEATDQLWLTVLPAPARKPESPK